MKKLVLTTVCALAMTGAAFAAGNINWGSIGFASMTAQTNATQYSPLFGGAATGSGSIGAPANGSLNTYYELLYTSFSGSQATIPSLASLLSWTDSGLSATNNPGNGARLVVVAANSGATVPWSPGTTDSIVLVGWSANLGTSWLSVSNTLKSGTFGANSFFGVSTTGYITTFDTATSPGATVFAPGATSEGLPIFSLNTQLYLLPVPEPTTIALAGLGGLSLLLFRRQRK
jgi:hypothetical protein